MVGASNRVAGDVRPARELPGDWDQLISLMPAHLDVLGGGLLGRGTGGLGAIWLSFFIPFTSFPSLVSVPMLSSLGEVAQKCEARRHYLKLL